MSAKQRIIFYLFKLIENFSLFVNVCYVIVKWIYT